jgi:hypothetical protein
MLQNSIIFLNSQYNSATVDHLSKLLVLVSSKDVIYVTFAICDDDTNNCYIQGLVKTTRRCSVGLPKRIIGDAIFSIATCVYDILVDIHLKPSFVEIGKTPFEKYRGELASLKCTIDRGTFSIDQLLQTYPYICSQYTRQILRYIHDVSTKLETPAQPQVQRIPCA